MDVVARAARRRRLRPGRRAAPRHLARAARGRPEPARRAQAPRLPHARLARQGAQEGRPQEGPQAAAVLQALAPARSGEHGPQAVRDRRRPRRRGRVPRRRAGARARRARRRAQTGAERPQVLIIRDTRESGEMLEAARRRRRQRGRRRRAARRRAADAGRAAADRAATASTSASCCRPRTTPTRTTASSSSAPTATSSPTTAEARDRSRRRARRRDAGRGRSGRVRALHGALEDYLRALHARFADLDLGGRRRAARLRQRRDLPRRAGDLPPPRRARRP